MKKQPRNESSQRFEVTHGARSSPALDALTIEKRELVSDMLAGTSASTNKIAIDLLARNLAKIDLFDKYLSEHGFADDPSNPELQGILKVYWLSVNSATRLCKSLGIIVEPKGTSDTLSLIQEAKNKGMDVI